MTSASSARSSPGSSARPASSKRRVFVHGNVERRADVSYRMACEASDLVRAIAPVAGTDNTLACTPPWPVPVIHFHAADDDHVLFNGGSGKKALSGDQLHRCPG